jgi:hypothetical protein
VNRAEPHIPGLKPVYRGCPQNATLKSYFRLEPTVEKRRARHTSFENSVEFNVDGS